MKSKDRINLKKLSPMEVIARNLLIADLSTIPPEMIFKIAPEICIDMEHQIQQEDGTIISEEVKIINWAKVLFQINTVKLEFILSHFTLKNKVYTEEDKKEMEKNAQQIFSSLAGDLGKL